MSFDLRLENGDITFGPDGNPVTVTNLEKLRQDISKILLTRQGSDPGSIQYGSRLQDVLGKSFDIGILQGLVAKNVAEAINYLQSIQSVQSTKQDMSYQEIIGSIDSLGVQANGFGKLDIQLAVTSMQGLRTIFALRLGEGE